MGKPGDLLQSLAEGGDNCVVALLDDFRAEEAPLPGFDISSLTPGFIAPISVHAFDPGLRHILGVAPYRAAVHVHDREVEQQVDRPRLACLEDHLPVEIGLIGIKQA